MSQFRGCSSVVERNLAKVDVVGSNPITRLRSKYQYSKAFRGFLEALFVWYLLSHLCQPMPLVADPYP
jgi:hypothetical protein